MTSNKEIQDELNEISPVVAGIPRVNTFSVPENYFNELPFNILQLQQSDITPSFAKISEPLSVPEGYFDGLAGSILNKIKSQAIESAAAEIAKLSPTIAAIGNKNIFTTPRSYFDHVSTQVLDSIAKENAPAKVVEMKKRPGFIRYMAAAAVAGVIGLSIFNLTGKNAAGNVTTEIPAMAEAEKIIKDKSFDAELNSLTDKDIEQYLKESGQDVDAALVASATDDTNLPSAEDYIIDDNTLNEFLNKINLNN